MGKVLQKIGGNTGFKNDDRASLCRIGKAASLGGKTTVPFAGFALSKPEDANEDLEAARGKRDDDEDEREIYLRKRRSDMMVGALTAQRDSQLRQGRCRCQGSEANQKRRTKNKQGTNGSDPKEDAKDKDKKDTDAEEKQTKDSICVYLKDNVNR